jgi:hypothetical protein
MNRFNKAFGVMDQNGNGDWVKYDDAKAEIDHQYELMNKERGDLLDSWDETIDHNIDLIRQLNKLNKQFVFWMTSAIGFFLMDLYLILKYVV